MTVAVIEIFSADICRDGGSRCFCFHSDDGNWYEFHVPIKRVDGEISGHREPSLYLNSINDRNVVHQFSWGEALEFVSELHFDNERFRELVDVVVNRGEIKAA